MRVNTVAEEPQSEEPQSEEPQSFCQMRTFFGRLIKSLSLALKMSIDLVEERNQLCTSTD